MQQKLFEAFDFNNGSCLIDVWPRGNVNTDDLSRVVNACRGQATKCPLKLGCSTIHVHTSLICTDILSQRGNNNNNNNNNKTYLYMMAMMMKEELTLAWR